MVLVNQDYSRDILFGQWAALKEYSVNRLLYDEGD